MINKKKKRKDTDVRPTAKKKKKKGSVCKVTTQDADNSIRSGQAIGICPVQKKKKTELKRWFMEGLNR